MIRALSTLMKFFNYERVFFEVNPVYAGQHVRISWSNLKRSREVGVVFLQVRREFYFYHTRATGGSYEVNGGRPVRVDRETRSFRFESCLNFAAAKNDIRRIEREAASQRRVRVK